MICDSFSFWYRRKLKFKLESDIQQKISVVIRGTIPKVLYWNLYFSSLLKCNANKFVTSKFHNASNCTLPNRTTIIWMYCTHQNLYFYRCVPGIFYAIQGLINEFIEPYPNNFIIFLLKVKSDGLLPCRHGKIRKCA